MNRKKNRRDLSMLFSKETDILRLGRWPAPLYRLHHGLLCGEEVAHLRHERLKLGRRH